MVAIDVEAPALVVERVESAPVREAPAGQRYTFHQRLRFETAPVVGAFTGALTLFDADAEIEVETAPLSEALPAAGTEEASEALALPAPFGSVFAPTADALALVLSEPLALVEADDEVEAVDLTLALPLVLPTFAELAAAGCDALALVEVLALADCEALSPVTGLLVEGAVLAVSRVSAAAARGSTTAPPASGTA